MKETLRTAALAFQSVFNDFDASAADADDSVLLGPLRPIFIVGAPRTGSTLLYQLMVQQLQVSYLSNLMTALPKYMVRLIRHFPRLVSGPPANLHPGYFGFVPGLRAPSEAGKIFDRWFGLSNSERNAAAIKRTIAAISTAQQAPFVCKSLTNSTRLDRILALFPAARLVQIRRDPLFVAQSIYLARKELRIPDDGWWSVAVPGAERIRDRSPAYQSLWQAVMIERLLDASYTKLQVVPALLTYEDLCRTPVEAIGQLQTEFAVPWRPGRPAMPDVLQPADQIRVEAGVWREFELAQQDLQP